MLAAAFAAWTAIEGGSAAPAQGPASRISITRLPAEGVQPEVAVDERGQAHVAFLAGPTSSADVFYMRSADGGRTFSTPIRVNSQPGVAVPTGTVRGAALAVGSSGRIHVVWNGSSEARPRPPLNPATKTFGMPLLYARSNPAGTAFETQRNLITRTTHLDGGGSVAVDARGQVLVAWHGHPADGQGPEDVRRVWLTTSSNDGGSFAAERPIGAAGVGTCGCCSVRIAAIRDELHLLYRSATASVHRDIRALTSRDGGATFADELVDRWEIGACPMTSTSIAAGTRVWRAWETDEQVFLNAAGTAGAIAPPQRGDGTDQKPRKHPRIVVGRDGSFLLLWSEGTGWRRGGSIAWQVFTSDGTATTERGSRADLRPWHYANGLSRADGGFTILY